MTGRVVEDTVELMAERSPGYRRFAQLTTDSVRAEAVADDLAVLARSDPHRFAIDNPSPLPREEPTRR